jgi:protein-tyrosine-phosphatase
MNAVRSPMAELLARRIAAPPHFVASAGVRGGERDPFVDAVRREGLSLASASRARWTISRRAIST